MTEPTEDEATEDEPTDDLVLSTRVIREDIMELHEARPGARRHGRAALPGCVDPDPHQ
ncbi:MAG: hypothetical protein ACREXX_02570 [Gammaproteobacteria bacterium]